MTSGVYVIVADEVGRFKLGCSGDVDRRLEEIQTCSPVSLRLHDVLEGAGFEIEAAIHGLLYAHHVHGEWFDLSGLPIAERHFGILRRAAAEVAEIIAEHVPGEWWDAVKANLYSAGAKNIADALSNITGESLMDRRFGT